MEGSRAAARDALNDCIAQLEQVVPHARMGEPITLHAVTPYPQVMETTFGREVRSSQYIFQLFLILVPKLWFAGLHAIHHWSMVRLCLLPHHASANFF